MWKKWFLIVGVVVVLLGSAGFFIRRELISAQAKLQIETNVPAAVYINGEEIGKTPFEDYFTPGDVSLRLVPEATEIPLAPWTGKVSLEEGVLTVIRRNFGQTERDSSGEMLSYEKLGGSISELVVVSVPDAAQISFSGERRGFTPFKTEIAPGVYEIAVSHPGFIERAIGGVKATVGYRLTAVVSLAQEAQEDQPVESNNNSEVIEIDKFVVEVLNGSGTSGTAGRVKDLLTAGGFSNIVTGNADSYVYTNTEVAFKENIQVGVFGSIEGLLKNYNVVKAKDPLSKDYKYDIVIIVGKEEE